MAVLKTTSPATGFSKPNDLPWKRLPSSRIKLHFSLIQLKLINLFYIINKCLVQHLHTARRRIIAAEVPVTRMLGAGLMQPFERLVDNLHFGFRTLLGVSSSTILAEISSSVKGAYISFT